MVDFSKQVSATKRIASLADEALVELDAFCQSPSNGLGLFADPSSQRARLVRAVRAASTALATFDDTRWPTPDELARADGWV